MKDPHVREKLSEYIDGMLDQKEVFAVKEHLDRCPKCKEVYTEMVKIIGHMNQMESLEAPDSFLEKVNARMEKPSSLQKFVKGLFLPVQIKLPLEIAGLAAAALLVVYIFGIRGKQHIYELAYFQRSQPHTTLQEQTPEAGAEVDETIMLSKKAQPKLEFEAKKVEKSDTRGVAEEAIPTGKKDMPDLARQEKRMERRAQLEDLATPRRVGKENEKRDVEPQDVPIERESPIATEAPSVARDRRAEPSIEIVDTEKEEAEKVAFIKPTSREKYLEDIITALGGKIIESEYRADTQALEYLVMEITAGKYQELIQILEEQGDILKPYPAIKEKDQEFITIRLLIQQ